MKKIKYVLILMIIVLILIVIGSFIVYEKDKYNEKKYGTPISDESISYMIENICSDLNDCDSDVEIDNFYDQTLMINYKYSKDDNINQLTINNYIFRAFDNTNIDSFGTYKNKFFVIVYKWNTSLTDANKEVIYYDKNFNVVYDIKLADSTFDIEKSTYNYYTCEDNPSAQSEDEKQKYTKNTLTIDKDLNFNLSKDSEMFQACSSSGGY